MPMQVCMGAQMQCSFGAVPSALVVLPANKVFTGMVPDANIMDHIPMTNIMPFGVCNWIANPTVAAAATAAGGGINADAVYSEYACPVSAGRGYREYGFVTDAG